MNLFVRPAAVLRVEAACVLAASIFVYAHLHFSWVWFAVLFFVPDLSMAGYLLNVRAGASIYNVGHILILPLALLGAGYEAGRPWMVMAGVIWLAHIEFDRMLGFGLKYPTFFKDTHLQHLELEAEATA